jgi:GntR family transcriptional regulator, rspAB operon transcriptional repressor
MEKIQQDALGNKVYEALLGRILRCELKVGERLKIRDIATRLGVSPTPVKDAFNRLALEGLLHIIPNSGTYVSPLPVEDIEDIYDIRLPLEILAVKKGVARVTDAAIKKMRRIVIQADKSLNSGNRRRFNYIRYLEYDAEFHHLIVEQSGSRRLIEMYRSLHSHMHMFRLEYAFGGGNSESMIQHLRDIQKQHEGILTAFENRDAAKLQQALQQHLEVNKSAILATIEQHGGVV